MVEMDYMFDADAVWIECQRDDLLSNYALPEREILIRLRVDDVEVFGHTEEGYKRWMDSLKSNKVPLHVPSPAWSLLSVLSIASSVDDAFRSLREEGRADIDSLDCVIRLKQQDDIVMVYIDPTRAGRAPYAEMYAAFSSFAERVRHDFLSVCPQLRDHVTLGSWFRGDETPARAESPQVVIYLPPTRDHTSHD